jgi:hypothetical protein
LINKTEDSSSDVPAGESGMGSFEDYGNESGLVRLNDDYEEPAEVSTAPEEPADVSIAQEEPEEEIQYKKYLDDDENDDDYMSETDRAIAELTERFEKGQIS